MADHEDKDASAEKQTFFGGHKDLSCWEQYEESLRDALYSSHPHAVPLLVAAVIASVGWLVGYLWAFVAYDHHKVDGCTKPLLAFLVVEGVVGIINVALAFATAGVCYNLATSYTAEKLKELNKIPRNFVGIVTTYIAWSIWHFAWFVVGTAWVFQLGRHDPPCHKPLYDFCWYFLTVGWGWYLLMALIGWMLSMCLPPPKKETPLAKRKASGGGHGGDRPNQAAMASSSSAQPSVTPL